MANKQDLIAKVAEATELTKRFSSSCWVGPAAVSEYRKVKKFNWSVLGNFEVRERAARKARNPTGARNCTAASKVPAFKAGKALKEEVPDEKLILDF